MNEHRFDDLPADSPIRTYAEKHKLSPKAREELLALVVKMFIKFEMVDNLEVLDPDGLEDEDEEETIH